MKQQLLEKYRDNALAVLKQADNYLSEGDIKHAQDFVSRAIHLLENSKR